VNTGLTQQEVASVYQRYGAFLRRRARLVTRDSALAEDALHDACLNLLRSGAAFREATAPLGWLYRVIDRTSLDQLRRGKRLRSATPLDSLDPIGAPPGVDGDLRLRALELLRDLDEESAQITILLYVDGMNQSEIAAHLGYSRVTISKRIRALRERASWFVDAEEPSS